MGVLITGRLTCSIEDFSNRCEVLIEEEQNKLSPDNALIAVLCDAIRLGRREYVEYVQSSNHIPIIKGGL